MKTTINWTPEQQNSNTVFFKLLYYYTFNVMFYTVDTFMTHSGNSSTQKSAAHKFRSNTVMDISKSPIHLAYMLLDCGKQTGAPGANPADIGRTRKLQTERNRPTHARDRTQDLLSFKRQCYPLRHRATPWRHRYNKSFFFWCNQSST